MATKAAMCELAPGSKVMVATFRRAIGGRLNDGSDQRTRKECWGAKSADGRWEFERVEDTGTPWIIRPTDPEVRKVARFVGWSYGSLAKCREAVASGQADRDLADELAKAQRRAG